MNKIETQEKKIVAVVTELDSVIKKARRLLKNSGVRAFTIRDMNSVHFLTSEEFKALPECIYDVDIESSSFLSVNFGDLCRIENKDE